MAQSVPNGSQAPKLDLFNFDAPDHQSSRYILTSPRSLQACARLGVKPVELLPKSIQQFSQSVPSLGGQRDQNDTTLNSVYKEFEKERLSKLQAARREREKIIADLETVPQPVKSFQLRHVQTNKLQNANGEIKNPSGRHRMTSALGPSEGERVHSPRRTTCTAVLRDEDHRILRALETRYEDEKKASLLRETVDLQRDSQRRKEEMDSEQRQMQHQRELAQSQRQFKLQMSQLKAIQSAIADEEKNHLLCNLQSKKDRWETSAELQAKARTQKLEEKRFLEERKKKLQKQRLSEMEAEDEMTREEASEYWRQVENRAKENHAMITTQEAMERQMKRAAAETQHKQRRLEIEEEVRWETEALRTQLAERDRCVEERYLIQKEHKEARIRQASDSRTQRALQQKQTAEQIEQQLDEWRRDLQTHRQQTMEHAERVTQRLVEEKGKRAHLVRTKRERNHLERLGHILEDERERRLQYAEEIELKNERSELIARERDSFLRQSRHAAYEGAKQRNQVKNRYLRNSFDRMVHQAELLASLERKPLRRTSQVTQSSTKVILG